MVMISTIDFRFREIHGIRWTDDVISQLSKCPNRSFDHRSIASVGDFLAKCERRMEFHRNKHLQDARTSTPFIVGHLGDRLELEEMPSSPNLSIVPHIEEESTNAKNHDRSSSKRCNTNSNNTKWPTTHSWAHTLNYGLHTTSIANERNTNKEVKSKLWSCHAM